MDDEEAAVDMEEVAKDKKQKAEDRKKKVAAAKAKGKAKSRGRDLFDLCRVTFPEGAAEGASEDEQ